MYRLILNPIRGGFMIKTLLIAVFALFSFSMHCYSEDLFEGLANQVKTEHPEENRNVTDIESQLKAQKEINALVKTLNKAAAYYSDACKSHKTSDVALTCSSDLPGAGFFKTSNKFLSFQNYEFISYVEKRPNALFVLNNITGKKLVTGRVAANGNYATFSLSGRGLSYVGGRMDTNRNVTSLFDTSYSACGSGKNSIIGFAGYFLGVQQEPLFLLDANSLLLPNVLGSLDYSDFISCK